jgi:hypothetical protein
VKKWLAFLLTVLIWNALHEGTHVLVAKAYGEYEAFHVRPIGLEVEFSTPVAERGGIKWAFISGTSSLMTLLMGYSLLGLGRRFARARSTFLQACVYYLTFISLLLDPLNLSIGPFIYRGDAIGIGVGLGISRYMVQGVYLLLLLANHELVARKLVPMYNVETEHILFKPWIPLPKPK